MSLGLRPIGAYAPEGTTEETPAKHFHFKTRANCFATSVDKDQLSVFGEGRGNKMIV
jgi:hypothetical protein